MYEYEKGTFHVWHVLVCTFMWTTVYFLLCLRDPQRSYEWHCRMVTIIHASIISALAFYGVFALGPWPWSEAGGPNTPHQVRTCTICLGYFLFDFVWCLYFKTEGPTMLTHHTLSIVGLSWCLLAGRYGTELLATIGGAEITNPLLQVRWFTKEAGYYNSIWGDVIDVTFMLSFGFVRIYLGTILLYKYYQQPTDFLGRLGGTLIYLIGWAFFISIVQFAVYKYSKRFQEWRRGSASRDPSLASGSGSEGRKDVTDNIIKEQEIPTQREIKHLDGELNVRKNCVVKES